MRHPSPYLGALACPSTPKVLQVRKHAPTPCLSVVFTFRLAFESTKEFGGVSSVKSIEFVVFITKLAAIVTKSFQHVQVEHVQMENPQFLRFQPIPVFNHLI